MKFLFDTNIWIPLEPTSVDDVAPDTPVLTELVRLIGESGNTTYVHPASFLDLANDTNAVRRHVRTQLLDKYSRLPDAPSVSAVLRAAIGTAPEGSNDFVDDFLLASVERDAVDYLVTADARIHAKARRANLARRVVTAVEALSIVRNLFPPAPVVIPPVRRVKVHALNERDSIFDSFRADYPGFDDWLRRCKLTHRDAWVVGGPAQGPLAFAILKREQPADFGLPSPAMKLCSFKVGDHARGFRYGELLLRAVFEDAYRSDVKSLYATVFDRYQDLIRLFTNFGFDQLSGVTTRLGELVFTKPVHPTGADRGLSPLQYHVRFGPRYLRTADARFFVVPIQPEYHRMLFPDLETQGALFPGETTFGNGIAKAYLCHAPIRRLEPGDVLLFYRSVSGHARAVGVIEDTLVSRNPEEISRFVGRRTVYDFDAIQAMCAHGDVLAILFRQAESLSAWLAYHEMVHQGVIVGPPQSIAQVSQTEGVNWLANQLERSR
jgi:hypothetical protein